MYKTLAVPLFPRVGFMHIDRKPRCREQLLPVGLTKSSIQRIRLSFRREESSPPLFPNFPTGVRRNRARLSLLPSRLGFKGNEEARVRHFSFRASMDLHGLLATSQITNYSKASRRQENYPDEACSIALVFHSSELSRQ